MDRALEVSGGELSEGGVSVGEVRVDEGKEGGAMMLTGSTASRSRRSAAAEADSVRLSRLSRCAPQSYCSYGLVRSAGGIRCKELAAEFWEGARSETAMPRY